MRVFLLTKADEVLLLTPLADDIVLLGKGDLRAGDVGAISGATGQGVDQLIARMRDVLEKRVSNTGVMTRERHRVAMLNAIVTMESALDELDRLAYRAELVAADLRRAVRFLDQLVGRIDVENLLDEIFASFCIGK